MSITPRNRAVLQWALFLGATVASVTATFLAYELRYMWYASKNDFIFLRTAFGASLLVIALLWFLYPSRMLVAIVALTCFSLPPLLRGERFVPLDVGFLCVVGMCLVLLVVATQLRRRLREPK